MLVKARAQRELPPVLPWVQEQVLPEAAEEVRMWRRPLV